VCLLNKFCKKFCHISIPVRKITRVYSLRRFSKADNSWKINDFYLVNPTARPRRRLIPEMFDLLTLLANFLHCLNTYLKVDFGPYLGYARVRLLGLDPIRCDRDVGYK